MKAIYIGRFSPLHYGHIKIINFMLDAFNPADCLLILGSANAPLSEKNMFKYYQRREWINELYPELKIVAVPDFDNDYDWAQNVENIVNATFCQSYNRVFLGGSEHDLWYCDLRNWNKLIISRSIIPISGTEIRKMLLNNEDISNHVHFSLSTKIKEPLS